MKNKILYHSVLAKEFNEKFQIFENQSFSYTYLGFNLKTKKWQEKRLREAIALAIDKQEIIDILFFSHGKVATGPFLPGSFAFNRNIKGVQYNTKKATELLASLGYNKKNRFTFTLHTSANNPTRLNTALVLQHQLQKVNIDMKIKVLEWQAFLNTVVLPKKFDAILLGWGLGLMPDARSIWHSASDTKGGFNLVGYKNEKVDKAIELAETTTDPKKLATLYQEIFAHITNDTPYLFLYIPNSITAVSKKVHNVSDSFIGIGHNQNNWVLQE